MKEERYIYTILDVLDKFIYMEKNLYKVYIQITELDNPQQSIKTMAQVLAREEKRHIKTYEHIKNKLRSKEGVDIDFESYDKISKALSVFNSIPLDIKFESTHDLLKYTLDFEEKHLALVINIQGILVKKLEDKSTIPYKVLSEVINEKNKYVQSLEKFIK